MIYFTFVGNQVQAQEESWAVFDTDKVAATEITNTKSPRGTSTITFIIFSLCLIIYSE